MRSIDAVLLKVAGELLAELHWWPPWWLRARDMQPRARGLELEANTRG